MVNTTICWERRRVENMEIPIEFLKFIERNWVEIRLIKCGTMRGEMHAVGG